MSKLVKTILLAAPLFALALPALAQKPRKASAAVSVSVPVAPVSTPAARGAVGTPLPVVSAGVPVARVAVAGPAPVVAVAAPVPVVAVSAPVVTYSGTLPMAAVQMQVTTEGTYVASGPVVVNEVQVQAAPSCNLRSDGDLQSVLAAIKSE